jgi:ATP-dependent helicase HrpB
MMEADLAPLALELAAWGADPNELHWLDRPPAPALAQARELLQRLGALSGTAITSHGRRLAETGLHPRLAHMIVLAITLGLGGLACDLAAIVSERDVLQGKERFDTDIRLRVERLQQNCPEFRRVMAEALNWRRWFGLKNDCCAIDKCGLLLSFAYPDRIGQQRSDGRYLLTNGRGVAFANTQPLSGEAYICVAELDDKGTEGRIALAAPVTLTDLRANFASSIITENNIIWEREAKALRAKRTEKLGALVLNESPLADPEPSACLAALMLGIQVEGLSLLPWGRTVAQLRQRMLFMHQLDSAWPDMSDDILVATLEIWLAPYLYGIKNANDLQRLNLLAIFESMLTWQQRRELDEYAPTHLIVPSGQNLPIDYSDLSNPSLSVRLQEMFGQTETPRIGRGRVPLTLNLLSPARRPVQVTKDLASFWRTTYFEVKKDLMGRYPKHYWPEDPLQAIPTHRVRPPVDE